jgi:hypothetical protein
MNCDKTCFGTVLLAVIIGVISMFIPPSVGNAGISNSDFRVLDYYSMRLQYKNLDSNWDSSDLNSTLNTIERNSVVINEAIDSMESIHGELVESIKTYKQ